MVKDISWDELNKFNDSLKNKYPKLLSKIGNDSLAPIRRGLQCGNGWLKILRPLFEELSKYDIVLEQVKEKFGGLRIYWSSNLELSDEDEKTIRDLIHKAEEECWKICETCGAEGELVNEKGWLFVSCEKCKKKGWKERENYIKKLQKEGLLLTPYELMFGKSE
jgi:hypothetical protein